MAPVAVPSMDDLKLDDPKVEKKPDVVNDEEGDDDDDEEVEGGETAATGGRSILDALRTQKTLEPCTDWAQMQRKRKRRRSVSLYLP